MPAFSGFTTTCGDLATFASRPAGRFYYPFFPVMLDLLAKFENKRPEIVFEWKDAETEAEGWVVINSRRGGAAAVPAYARAWISAR